MKVLVTGGSGFIGSHLVDALLAQDCDVTVVDDLSSGSTHGLDPRAALFECDVADLNALRQPVEGAEVVFHLAAHRAVLRSVEDPVATDLANVHGTVSVLKAAMDAGVRRVVYASSSSVYGGAEELPTPESAPTEPRSPYAVSKLAGEHYCRVFADLYGLETVALRYFNVYGPRQSPESRYAAVIPLFIDALVRGERPTVHGDGRQSRDFTYVDDVVAATLAAASAAAERCSGRVYNVAAGERHDLLELLEIVAETLGVQPAPVHTDPRPGDVRHTHADVSAAKRDLGYVPGVPFEEGLRRTVESLRPR